LAIAIDNSLEPVLIVGESGVGKELAARAVHDLGHSPKSPLVSVNAATLSPTLLEAELFGYERGAFTDAKETHVGYCGECKDGTLFLDEIGEIPDSLQARLLRVIQERKYRPKMGVRDLPFKGRIVLATNKNLIQEVEAKRFRQDLYQRINVHEIRLPSLRERRNDWLLMAEHFLKEYAPSSGLRLSQEVREILRHYSFPGNTRQLENIIKHVLVHRPTNEIRPHHLPPQLVADACASAGESQTTLAWPEEWMCLPYKDAKERVLLGFDAVYFRKILDRHEGHQANAAKEAGLDPKTFRDKSQKSGL
jgi:DNA-binding NtrC family response regulator